MKHNDGEYNGWLRMCPGAGTLGMASLALLSAGTIQAAEVEIQVRLDQPGASISPYVYGQFIEHMGRGIHDGIWAEKLQDRKFLLEPAKSPWKPVQPAGAEFELIHDTAGAYAGERCMELWLRKAVDDPSGIRQGDLGLLAGKEYIGYIFLSNIDSGLASVDVRLAWGNEPGAGQNVHIDGVGRGYHKFPFRFSAGATTDSALLSVLLPKAAHIWIGCVSLMPADNVKGLRRDTLELMKKLNPTIIRWPGGNFVSGYDWKDGIGDRDRRPPRWERAWGADEDNDFGLDEFMAFCDEVGTEPYIAVNSGLGRVEDAGDEVEYATGASNTPWGGNRARNGRAKPYAVKWWGVGNEMFGGWQLGVVSAERYAFRHNAFVAAMKARQPDIKIIAVGAPGGWNDVMFPRCAANMDLISGHHYSERKLRVPFTVEDAAKFEQRFTADSDKVAAGLRGLITDLRNRRAKGDSEVKRVGLAVDEWGMVNDWNGAPDAPGIGIFEHYYTLGDAVTIGRGLHELLRASDVVAMANWSETVNVVGAIKTNRNFACLDPVGHLLALYRARFGGAVVPVAVKASDTVDAVAAWDKKTDVLSIGLINFSASEEVAVAVRLPGDGKSTSVRAWRIGGGNLGAINVPGQPEAVTTTEVAERIHLDRVVLPKYSITVLCIKSPSRNTSPSN